MIIVPDTPAAVGTSYRLNTEHQRREQAAGRKGARDADNNGGTTEDESFLHDVGEHAEAVRAKRHANADLAASRRDATIQENMSDAR